MNNTEDTDLPTPNFSFNPPLRYRTGIRPFRDDGLRLDGEIPAASPKKLIVHNYGHGGAGITLSWGCASKVRDIVSAHLPPTGVATPMAVLGSGVMGLTAATLLRKLGLPVTIYAKRMWDSTTSSVAGGEWGPSVVNYSNEQQFTEILRIAYGTFKSSIGKGFGVSERPYYSPVPSSALEKVMILAPGLLPPRETLPRLPFKNHTTGGYLYRTLLVEPPIFLKRLESDLRADNVAFIQRNFSSVADVLSLPEDIIVNCTGFGSRALWNDRSLRPIKGQLALLPAQPQLQYLYSQAGYLFPRTDAVIIGGTFEDDCASAEPDPDSCKHLVDHMASLFGEGPPVVMSEHHIHHPINLARIAPKLVAGA